MRFPQTFILFILLFGSVSKIQAQTDTVLIGDSPDADYSSLNLFIASQSNQTLSDTLIAKVLPGVYIGDYELNNLEGFPLVIEGIYPEPDSVVIIPTGVKFSIFSVENIVFRNIFFQAESDFNSALLDVDNCDYASFYNCKFEAFNTTQDRALDFGSGEELRIENCVLLSGEIRTSVGDIYLIDNFFDGYVDLQGANICRDNVFINIARLNAGEFWDNVFHDDVRFRGGVNFHHNLCYGDVHSSFSDDVTLHGNITHGRVSLNGGNNYTLYNNHFFNIVEIVYMDQPTLRVLSNNFGPDARLECMPWTIDLIANNIFTQDIHFTYGNIGSLTGYIKDNSFWPDPSNYGTYRHHLDPMYYSNDSLVATNPMLVGQAGFVWSSPVDVDILGIPRPLNACIGANEYCMNADSLFITCGQTVGSRLCSFPDNADLVVEPVEFVANLNHDFPMLKPTVSTTFYLTDEISGITDSLYVVVDSLHITSQPLLETSCSVPVQLLEFPLHNYYGSSFNISWTPEQGIDESLPYEWWAIINETTTYHYTIEHAWCGIFEDSITVFVHDIPLAYGETDVITSNNGIINFQNLSECENQVHWEFGDGSQSDEENPTHTFTNIGVYTWTLTASNDNYSDSFIGAVQIFFPISTENLQVNSANIFPNPAQNSFTIELSSQIVSPQEVRISDLNGNTVYKGNMLEQITIDSGRWAPGFYVIETGNLKSKLLIY